MKLRPKKLRPPVVRKKEPPPKETAADARLRAKRMAYFRKHRDSLTEKLMQCVLRSLAAYDAASIVNEQIAEKLGMPAAGLDQSDVEQVQERITRLEVEALLIDASSLSPRAKREFVDRLVARVAPNRDGPAAPQPVGLQDVGALRRALSKSIERQFPAAPAGDANLGKRTWPPQPQNRNPRNAGK